MQLDNKIEIQSETEQNKNQREKNETSKIKQSPFMPLSQNPEISPLIEYPIDVYKDFNKSCLYWN